MVIIIVYHILIYIIKWISVVIKKIVLEMAETTTENLLPAKSRKFYESAYKTFMEWRDNKETTSFSENVMLAYFGELSQKLKASSLWTQYSMLRSTLQIHHNIELNMYRKLRAFLKRQSHGYQAKKTKTFTPEQINSFIENANDQKYLATKVALIMGVMGACRCNELKEMNIENVQDLTSAILVNVPDTKTKLVRNFTITGNFYEIVKKYISLRPPNVQSSSFFLNYRKGKCTNQNIGINKFSAMGKQIATFLNLPDQNLYTGHSFRRTSAILLVDTRADNTALKRYRGWKLTAVPEGLQRESSGSNTIDNATENNLERDTQFRIKCPLCEENEEAKNYEKLNQHLKEKHGQETENETLNFFNFEECCKWMELENIKDNYVVTSTIKECEYTTTTYECNRHNFKKYKSKCVKTTGKTGESENIKGYCPSRVIVNIFKNGEVTVQFCKTHLGHPFAITSNIVIKEEKNEEEGHPLPITSNIVIKEEVDEEEEEEEDYYTKYKKEVKTWINYMVNMEQLLLQMDPETGYRIMKEAMDAMKKIENEV